MDGTSNQPPQRSRRQLDKAEDKLNRMRRLATEQQRKAEEDIKRLTKEYAEMSEERRDNDRQVEELKQEADEIERKVRDSFRGLFNRGCTKLMGSLPPPPWQ